MVGDGHGVWRCRFWKRNVGRPEEFQAGAAEIQVTEETVHVGTEDLQVGKEEVQVMVAQIMGQNGQGGQEVGSGLAAGTQAMFDQGGGSHIYPVGFTD